MYDVAKFVKPKRQDWDNDCNDGASMADFEAFRYAREKAMGEIVRAGFKLPMREAQKQPNE